MAQQPSQILPHLFLGGKADAKSKTWLQQRGVKYILNCTPTRKADREAGVPNYYEKDRDFKYCRIPIFDNKGEDITFHLDTAFRFIEEAKHYGGILVHCLKGVSRSASFVIAYLMKKNEFSFDEALGYVQSIRPIVAPNVAFIAQLKAYDSQLITNRASAQDERETADSVKEVAGPAIGPSMPFPTDSIDSSIPSGQSDTPSFMNGTEVGEKSTRLEADDTDIVVPVIGTDDADIVAPVIGTDDTDVCVGSKRKSDVAQIDEIA